MYDTEWVALQLTTMDEGQIMENNRQVSELVNSPMSDSQYYMNMAKMTVMWTACSFTSYLLNYMNKYLEGSIYQNHYNECIAGLIAISFGA